MIEVSGLTKRFGSINALSDVSFTVEKGQIVGFLGANGAGKTTTMDIVCGCIGADQGVVKVAGFDITEQPIEAKKRLGYLPDIAPLMLEMRVDDYVEYAARLHGLKGKDLVQNLDKTLDKLSLTDVRRRIVGNLSKGYRQRVALAQALVHDPEVLVLDEPTEGLDPNQIVQIRELIRSLAGQHTIILSSHILSEVQNTCDRIVIIHKGKVIQQGTYNELVTAMQSGDTFKLGVKQNHKKLADDLKNMRGVSNLRSVEDEGYQIEFSVAANDNSAVEGVVRKVLDGGYGFKQLSPKTRSLEEVFFQLTK